MFAAWPNWYSKIEVFPVLRNAAHKSPHYLLQFLFFFTKSIFLWKWLCSFMTPYVSFIKFDEKDQKIGLSTEKLNTITLHGRREFENLLQI